MHVLKERKDRAAAAVNRRQLRSLAQARNGAEAGKATSSPRARPGTLLPALFRRRHLDELTTCLQQLYPLREQLAG